MNEETAMKPQGATGRKRMVKVSSPYGTLPSHGATLLRPHNHTILRNVATLAVACFALACLAVYGTRNSMMLLSKEHSLASTYVSGTDSRKDLDSYFDAPVAKKARRFSSDAAAKEMDEIFQNSKADRQDMKSRRDKIKRQQKSAITQDLSFSGKDANDDLDSYFDDMQEANARTNHLRKAQHELDDDGLPELHPAKAKAAQEEAAVNRQELENYKKHNPDFKKRMDKVHLMWMEKHGHLPKSKDEIKAYAQLVGKYVGDIEDLVKKARVSTQSTLKEDPKLRKQALEKYLRENPDVKKKMAAAKKAFWDKHHHAPKSERDQKEYHDMMQKYVGHIDISISKILGKGAKAAVKAKAVKYKATKLQKLNFWDPFAAAQAKADKHFHHARDTQNEKHVSKPMVRQQKAEAAPVADTSASKHEKLDFGKLDAAMAKGGPAAAAEEEGDINDVPTDISQSAPHVPGEVQIGKLIPVAPSDMETASPEQLRKMKQLKKYEHSDPQFAKKLNEVHSEWAKNHGGPPHTEAQQAEYAALLKKIVGTTPMSKRVKKVNPFHAPSLDNEFKVAGGKGVMSLAGKAQPKQLLKQEHSNAEVRMAKVKALQDLEEHDPKVKAKIDEVHHMWMKAGHKAPPHTPAEEKEYNALMEKIVGHPDISFQTD